MSTHEIHHVVYGVKMTYEDYEKRYKLAKNPEVHDKYTNKDPEPVSGLNVILDGMNGEYAVIGKVLVRADVYNSEGIEFTDVMAKLENSTEVMHKIQEHFKLTDLQMADKYMPKLYAFTHIY